MTSKDIGDVVTAFEEMRKLARGRFDALDVIKFVDAMRGTDQEDKLLDISNLEDVLAAGDVSEEEEIV